MAHPWGSHCGYRWNRPRRRHIPTPCTVGDVYRGAGDRASALLKGWVQLLVRTTAPKQRRDIRTSAQGCQSGKCSGHLELNLLGYRGGHRNSVPLTRCVLVLQDRLYRSGVQQWLQLPAITRKTDKGLPLYADERESDVFLAGDEDLVPVLVPTPDGWGPEPPQRETIGGVEYHVRGYRLRIEGDFARI